MNESVDATPVAVVTGAARGIGLAIARWFLARGQRVALIDIDADALRATERELADARHVLALPGDVSSPRDVREAFTQVDARFGRLDALVNNAGIAVGFDATGIGLPALRAAG
jgi:meso-butanediol dehydrogenase / (S,S)-butanediol dehydrogenase / diacetyl reductase